MTPHPALGGRAWPSFELKGDFDSPNHEKALAVWLNTTVGLIGRWYISSRQQPGRSMLSILRIGDIPAIDLNALNGKQLAAMASIFEEYKESHLQPAYQIDTDKTRQAMDEAILCGVMELPKDALESLQTLRSQWRAETSVRGHRK